MSENKRFVLVKNKNDVSLLDTKDDVNLELFGAFCEDEEGALFLVNSLDSIVCLLNEQDKVLKENGIDYV